MPFEEWENEGPLLVFLHGFPNNSLLWAPQVEHFKSRYHILNFNLPGSFHGKVKSKREFRTHHIQDFIIDTIKDRLKKHPKDVILVGHDLGCFILTEVGKQLSALIKAQIFISGMPLKLYSMQLKEPSQLMKSWYVGVLQLPGAPALVKKLLQKKMKKRAYSISHIREDSPLCTEAPFGFEPVYLYQELAQKAAHLKPEQEKSIIPTTFIFGDDDRFLNIPSEHNARKLFENVEIKTLTGGHWINRQKIAEVNGLLAQIFQQVRRA